MKAKKTFLLLLALLCSVLTVSAQEVNRLSVSEKRMQRGTETQLTIDMDNLSEIVAVQFTLTLPSGFTITPSSAIITGRGAGHMVTARNMGNNRYKFAILSSTNSPLKGIKGSLVSVNLKANSTLDEDKDYEIIISDAVMGVKSGANVINEANNGIVHIVSLPNLHVTALECSEAIAGSDMTVSWTVCNDGRGNTGDIQWNDYVWLVPDIQGGTSMTGARLLKTVSNVSALASGESYNNTVNIPLEERIYGNYDVVVTSDMRSVTNIDLSSVGNVLPRPYNPTDSYLYASTDAQYNKVDEENETPTRSDNFRYKAIEIQIPPLADLQVPNVTVVVDNSESYAGENTVPSPLTTSGLASSTAFYSGKKVKVTATLQNKGGAATTPKNIACALYLSHNVNREDGLDYRLDSKNVEISLNPDETVEVTFTGHIPYEWSGETYFHVQVDLNDVVYESANTANNWGCTPQVNVLMTPGADFKPTSIKAPAQVSLNSQFDVTYSVANIGPGVPFSSRWTDKLYISSSANGLDGNAVCIGSCSRSGSYQIDKPVAVVAPAHVKQKAAGVTGGYTPKYKYVGDDYNATCSVKLPSLTPGTYYIYVKVDADNNVFEYDGEDNNILYSGKVELQSTDLATSLISISEENLITGDNVAVAWSVRNVGQSNISNRTITDAFYASSNADGSNAVQLATVTNTISLAKNVSKTFRTNITIPKNSSLTGLKYVFVKTNINNDIIESSTANNKSDNLQRTFEYVDAQSAEQAKVNGTNIAIFGLTAPATVDMGATINVSFSVRNAGTETIGKDVKKELFLSKSKTYDVSSAIALNMENGTLPSTADMQSGAKVNCSSHITLPSNIMGGNYYLIAYANRDKSVSEKTYNDNYSSLPIYLNGNLPDLTVSQLNVPNEIMTAEPVEISWTVSNNGTWSANATIASVYLSDDETLNTRTDKLIENFSVKQMAKGASIEQKATITIADGEAGNKYIIVSVDRNDAIEESDNTNNTATAQFTAVQSPLPDLAISNFSIEGDLKAGQTATVKATVKNVGVAPTRKDKWADAFYLCSDYNFDQNKATQLGSKSHVGVLQPGESYDLTATIKVPTDAQGYYVVYAMTDANDVIYESNTSNNTTRTTAAIVNSSATPAELAITRLSAPSSITAGESVTITYTVQNNSDNDAEGLLRDVIYMSKDNKLDASDEMIGVVTGDVCIEAGNSIEREVTGRITNMVEGSYYIIVKTNSTHSIAESDYDNNSRVCDAATSLNYARLSLGESASATTSGLFKLPVHDGISAKTLGLYLNHPEANPSTMYVAYESVPTTAKYDRKSSALEDGKQELLVPNVQSGNYYVLTQANSATNKSLNEFLLSDQTADDDVYMTISANEVQFGATSLSIKEGGNGGWLTTDIHGALFDSIMDFRLLRDKQYIPAESITFHDQTSTRTIFNLQDAAVGSYDVVSELPDGTQATLPNGFNVLPGTSVGLGVKLEGPKDTRFNGASPISVTYANGGNTDVSICELLIVVEGGNIATSIEGLKEEKHELHLIPDTGVDNRGYATISPGTQRTVNLFLQQTSGYTHVYLYVVK